MFLTEGDDHRVLLLFAIIALAAVVDGLDGTIVTIALPELGEMFDISATDASWIITIYFLMMAGLILVFGRMCDKGALKRIMMLGFLIFTVGSALCAVSQSFMMMLAFRAIQGVGAGMLSASGILVAVKHLPVKLTALGLSVSVLGYSVGAAVGPLIGGVLLQYVSWEWIFLINVPLGLTGLYLVYKALPRDSGFDSYSFDYLGSVLLFIGLVSGLYVMEGAPSRGIDGNSLMILVVFLIMMVLFIIRQRKVGNPVLDLKLFACRNTDFAILVFTIVNICCMGVFYLLPFYIQIVMGSSTLVSGALLCFGALVTIIVCIPVGKRVPIKGNRHYVLLSAISLVIMSLSLALAVESNILLIMLALVAYGLVWGFGGGSLSNRIVDSVDEDKRGSISPVISFIIYFGSALGSALYASLFGLASGSSGTSITDLTQGLFMDGFTFTMIVGTVLSIFALILAWIVKERKDSSSTDD